ncbi:hypothetical protein HGRIS_002508 [Hohenbuehelia grisea]|uniref:Homeobox domain-containing protein n=1 Tax=Hohenbuehelia grisea TaxID=104357 RepID=A0ABR3JKN8_9AGAR
MHFFQRDRVGEQCSLLFLQLFQPHIFQLPRDTINTLSHDQLKVDTTIIPRSIVNGIMPVSPPCGFILIKLLQIHGASDYNGATAPPVPQSFTYYDNNDPRYGAQPSLAPLHTAGRDERWNPAPYPTPGHIPASSHNVRSPTASYPNQYEAYAVDPTHAYPYGQMPLSHASMNPHHPPQPRSTSPYRGSGEGASQAYTPPPVSPTTDEPMIKKKRKRADAQQLKVLNDVYNRTAFPSTEERMSLAKQLDMSPRSVQIWFQNKRQSMRQTNRQSSSLAPSSHQPFSMPSHEMDDLPAGAGYLSSSAALAGSSYPMGRTSPDVARSMHSTSPSVTHRRPRSAEETDPRIWSAGGRSH